MIVNHSDLKVGYVKGHLLEKAHQLTKKKIGQAEFFKWFDQIFEIKADATLDEDEIERRHQEQLKAVHELYRRKGTTSARTTDYYD